jgi:TPR repeat protein
MYNRAALSGHARAQSQLGVAYQFGKFNQTIGDVEALKWYRQAAEIGDDDAQI